MGYDERVKLCKRPGCGELVPDEGRADRLYHSEACRQLAYRARLGERERESRLSRRPRSPRDRTLSAIRARRRAAGLSELRLDAWLSSLAAVEAARLLHEELVARHQRLPAPALRHGEPLFVTDPQAIEDFPKATMVGLASVQGPHREFKLCVVFGRPKDGR